MTDRGEALQQFVDAAFVAFEKFANHPESRRSIAQIFSRLKEPVAGRSGPEVRLPACSYLEEAFAADLQDQALRQLEERFRQIEPLVTWHRRSYEQGGASANFADGHANAMVIGPGGIEDRKDVWLGATILAPNVLYPDHDHAPEEVYLVLSEGKFRQGDGEWFSPGVGGSFYNVPGIKHSMRSLDVPLFAFWALQPDPEWIQVR